MKTFKLGQKPPPKEEWEIKLEQLNQIAYEYDVKRGKIKVEERKQKTFILKRRQ